MTATLNDPQGRSVARRPVTVRLVSVSRSVRGQNTSLAIHARTITDSQGRYAIPLVANGDIDDLGSYYLVREWELGERAIVVPPRTDPRVDSEGRVALLDIVVDGQTALPEPANRPPLYLLRAERGAANGVPSLGSDGKVPAGQLPASSGGGVPTTRTLTAGTGLLGGGTLESDRSFAVAYGSTAGTAAQGNDARLSDARTPTAHTHPAGEVTGLAQVASTGQYAHLTGRPTIPATYADLSGQVPDAAIPAIAITDYLGEVASEAAMLALTGQRGDWCTRTDRGTNWQITGSTPAELASWRELSYPASPVVSVFGRTGAVTGSKADVGLALVDNTPDLDKPISDATAAALATKADAAGVAAALAGKADAAATTAALATKASAADLATLATTVEGKADEADLDTLAAAVEGLVDAAALQAAVDGVTHRIVRVTDVSKVAPSYYAVQDTGSVWQILTDGPEYSIAAAAGEDIEVSWDCLVESAGTWWQDLVVVTGAGPSIQRYLTTKTNVAPFEGVPGNYPVGPSFQGRQFLGGFTTQVSDLDGGTVRLRWAVKANGAGGRMYANPNYPLTVSIRNSRVPA